MKLAKEIFKRHLVQIQFVVYILYLQSHAFALVVLWLSSPPQEGTHILSNLAHGGRGSYGNRNKSTVSTMF